MPPPMTCNVAPPTGGATPIIPRILMGIGFPPRYASQSCVTRNDWQNEPVQYTQTSRTISATLGEKTYRGDHEQRKDLARGKRTGSEALPTRALRRSRAGVPHSSARGRTVWPDR